jgi:predicted nucleic acid-binding protein
LTLALALPGSVAIIDELPARRVASRLGVPVTGTGGAGVEVQGKTKHAPHAQP